MPRMYKLKKPRPKRFVAWITHPVTGERLYARDYGYRAFPIGFKP